MMPKHSIYDANFDSDHDKFDDNCVAIISNCDNIREADSVNMHFRFGSTETKALVNWECVRTMISKNPANAAVLNSQDNYWVPSPENLDIKTFTNELIKIVNVIHKSVKCNDWAAKKANVTVVEDGQRRAIIGRDLFPQLGLSLTQTKQVKNVDQKKQIAVFNKETNSS